MLINDVNSFAFYVKFGQKLNENMTGMHAGPSDSRSVSVLTTGVQAECFCSCRLE